MVKSRLLTTSAEIGLRPRNLDLVSLSLTLPFEEYYSRIHQCHDRPHVETTHRVWKI